MCGLSHAGLISYDKLKTHLNKGGYIPTRLTPELFKHKTKPIYICLVVDDFGFKCVNKEENIHLIHHLSKEYKNTVNWKGQIFPSIHLDWDYDKCTVDLHITNFVKKFQIRFSHKHRWLQNPLPPLYPPQYGKKQQIVANYDTLSLTPPQLKLIQEIGGCSNITHPRCRWWLPLIPSPQTEAPLPLTILTTECNIFGLYSYSPWCTYTLHQ